MSFKYDRQHLTGQQKAIAAQRDKTNEILKPAPLLDESSVTDQRIIKFLESKGIAQSLQEISTALGVEELEILRSLNGISKKKIELEVTPLSSGTNTSVRYKIKK